MGYKQPDGSPWDGGFSPQQHSFMDEQSDVVTQRLNEANAAGRSDWDNMRTQAAAWTGAKINAGDIAADEAAKHYGDFAGKYTAHGTYEQVPGAGTGHLEGMVDAPFGVRQDYTLDPRSSWVDDSGRDVIYSDMGLLTAPSTPNIGAYTPAGTGQLEVNPGSAAHPLVTMEGKSGEQLVTPTSRGLLDSGEATRAYIDAQNAGAWTKPIAKNKAGVSDSVFIPMEASPSEEQMKALANLASDNGFFAVDTGRGVQLVNDSWSDVGKTRTGTTLGKEIKGDLGDQIDNIFPNADKQRVTVDTGYLDYESALANPGSGEATRTLLNTIESNPTAFKKLDESPAVRKKALANLERDAEYAKKHGMPLREDIQRARKIISEKGFSGLKKALDSGAILPAALMGIVPLVNRGASQEDA